MILLAIESLFKLWRSDSPCECRSLRTLCIIVVNNYTYVWVKLISLSCLCCGDCWRLELLNNIISINNKLTIVLVVFIKLCLVEIQSTQYIVLNLIPCCREFECCRNTLRVVIDRVACIVDDYIWLNNFLCSLVWDSNLDVTIIQYAVAIVDVNESNTYDWLTVYRVRTYIVREFCFGLAFLQFLSLFCIELIPWVSLTISLRELWTECCTLDCSVSSLAGLVSTLVACCQFKLVLQAVVF